MPEGARAAECMANLLQQVGPVEYGYRLQGFAAHVLLRLGASVTAINSSGHPDIVAKGSAGAIRLEVETDVGSHPLRFPSHADLAAVRPTRPGDSGFFAYFINGPRIRWLLVACELLAARQTPIAVATIAALADPSWSIAWTKAMTAIVTERCDRIWSYSYASLGRRALAGKGL